jgi:hypothetical protein
MSGFSEKTQVRLLMHHSTATVTATERPMGDPQADRKDSAAISELCTLARQHGGVVKSDAGFELHNREEFRGPGKMSREFYGGGITEWWQHAEATFNTLAASGAFFAAARGVIIQWLKNRGSGTISFEKGDLKIQVRTMNDLSRVLREIGLSKHLEDSSPQESQTGPDLGPT